MTFRQLAYRNVLRNLRSYAAFFLASVVSVMVFFVYSMFIFHPLFEEDGLGTMAVRGMLIAEVVLYVFTLFFLFYSMSAFLQARSKEFGVLVHLGMTKKQLSKMIFFEMMILGSISTAAGIAFGFAFSKFFFMVGREIMELESLPLYISWQPFLLTIGAFASLFIIISFISVGFIRTKRVLNLLQGYWRMDEVGKNSKMLSAAGVGFLLLSYILAALVDDETIYSMVFIIPPLATVGTYLFFTHSLHALLGLMKKNKTVFWHKTRLVSIADSSFKLRDSAQMFFIVTIVSTIAFLTVGTLASFTSYTGDFRESNPLSLIYISFEDDVQEEAHIALLKNQLEQKGLAYDSVQLSIKRQTSAASGNEVDILQASQFNRLASALGYETVEPAEGEGIFIPYSQESLATLNETVTDTVLLESGVPLFISTAYPHVLFPNHTLNANSIIVNDEDFEKIEEPLLGYTQEQSSFDYYAFHVPDWTATLGIGIQLSDKMDEAFETGDFEQISYYFENPGEDYRWFKSSFALMLFIGVMVAMVFLLAAGSFIYFKLYTGLERDRKQYNLLVRLGLTEKELLRIVNRQLVPQFFLPWIIALLHSSFAFISLQVVWDEFAELSILGEMAVVLAGFTIVQLLYFYLIRWRYIAHLQAP